MQYPQYMLNPGDMFSVDLDKVLFATGAPKGLPRSQDPKYINRKKSVKDEGEVSEDVEKAPAAAEGKTEGGEASAPTSTADVSKVKAEAAATQATVEKEQQMFNKSKEESSGINWWDDLNRDRTFDPLKPYRTPWRPRYFLSAFAFIPKYLEVNHNIGHAVYLRDPVAKPGQSEVCVLCGGEKGEVLMWGNRYQRRFTKRRYSWRTVGSCDGGRATGVYFRLYINTDRTFLGVGERTDGKNE